MTKPDQLTTLLGFLLFGYLALTAAGASLSPLSGKRANQSAAERSQ
jgi:hypothetical protein